MIDVAPSYGDDCEAERAVGAAGLASEVMITSKVQLPDDDERDFAGRIRRGLHESLGRLRRTHLDLFVLHTQLRPRDPAAPDPAGNLGWADYLGEVAVEFARLRDEGLIRAWGITAVGYPATVLDALRGDAAPRCRPGDRERAGPQWGHVDVRARGAFGQRGDPPGGDRGRGCGERDPGGGGRVR